MVEVPNARWPEGLWRAVAMPARPLLPGHVLELRLPGLPPQRPLRCPPWPRRRTSSLQAHPWGASLLRARQGSAGAACVTSSTSAPIGCGYRRGLKDAGQECAEVVAPLPDPGHVLAAATAIWAP